MKRTANVVFIAVILSLSAISGVSTEDTAAADNVAPSPQAWHDQLAKAEDMLSHRTDPRPSDITRVSGKAISGKASRIYDDLCAMVSMAVAEANWRISWCRPDCHPPCRDGMLRRASQCAGVRAAALMSPSIVRTWSPSPREWRLFGPPTDIEGTDSPQGRAARDSQNAVPVGAWLKSPTEV